MTWRAAATCALLLGAAAASVVLAYKLHQERARDCGDFETCYDYAGAVRAFIAIAVVDLIVAAACVSLVIRRDPERANVIAYAFTAATAVTSLTVVTVWLFISRPPPGTLVTVSGGGGVFAGTVAVLVRHRNAFTLALSAVALCVFGWVTLLAVVI